MVAKNNTTQLAANLGDNIKLTDFVNVELIDHKHLKMAMENEKWVEAITTDCGFNRMLENLLILHFLKRDKNVKKLFDPSINGPLVSLIHKARIAYAIGLIDKTSLNDLEQIHKIRNEFAHSIKMHFTDTKVLKFVEKLSTSKGHKITAKNSYKFYKRAVEQCNQCLIMGCNKALEQEINRQVAKGKTQED